MLYRNHILRTLSAASQAAIRGHLKPVTLERGQVIVEEGEGLSSVWFPETAVLSSLLIMRDGRMAEIGTIGCEAAAGLLSCISRAPSVTRITVQVSGAANALRAQDLRALAMSDPVLDCHLLQAAQVALDHSEQAIACNVFHGATPRLARRLLEIQDRAASDLFPMTQEAMAAALGVQRTTANSAAQQLKTAGAIRYSRGNVRVCDRSVLEAMSCDCYRPLKMPRPLVAVEEVDQQHVA